MRKFLKILFTLLLTSTLFFSHTYTAEKAVDEPEETEEVEEIEEELEEEGIEELEEVEDTEEEPLEVAAEEAVEDEDPVEEPDEVAAEEIEEETIVEDTEKEPEEEPEEAVEETVEDEDKVEEIEEETVVEDAEKVTPPKRQLTISKTTEPKSALPANTSVIIEQAAKNEAEIQSIEDKTEAETKRMQEQQRTLDDKLDKFHKETSEKLGTFKVIANEIKKYLDKEIGPSKERARLEMLYKKFIDKINTIVLDGEEIQTREETLHPQFKNLSAMYLNVSLSSAQARKLNGKIKNTPSQALLEKLQQTLGSATGAKKNFDTSKAIINKQIETIQNKTATVAKMIIEMQVEGKKLSEQIEKVGKAQAKEAKKAEIKAFKKITKNLQKAKYSDITIQLRWYEKIVASLAQAILKLRNKIRNATGITKKNGVVTKQTKGTAVDKLEAKIKQLEKEKRFAIKIQTKLKDIEKQKRELLEKLQMKADPKERQETIGQKAKNMLTSTYDFLASIFLKMGSAINRGLQNAAEMGQVKKKKASKAK